MQPDPVQTIPRLATGDLPPSGGYCFRPDRQQRVVVPGGRLTSGMCAGLPGARDDGAPRD